ncbi:MAG: hypothetical protein AAGA23_19775 [Pseudomonadota bacterium]
MNTRFSILLATLTTTAYCATVWYAGNLFAVVTGPDSAANVSRLSVWTILPLPLSTTYNMIHWQALALASLFFAFYRTLRNADPSAQPLTDHYGLLLLAFFVNLIGFGISTVAVAHSL